MKHNILIVIFSFVFALTVVEILLRVYNPNSSHQNHSYLFDNKLGWIHKPNSTFRNFTSDFNALSTINSLSLRDSKFLNNKKNILVLGDSMVEARQVNDDEVFTELLENTYKDFEFLNAGVSGYGTIQQLLLFERLVKEIKFEYVFLFYSKLNDWLDTSYEYQNYLNISNITSRPFYDKDLKLIKNPINNQNNSALKNFLKNFRFINIIYNALSSIKLSIKNTKIEQNLKNKKSKIFNSDDVLFIESWNQNRKILKKLNNVIQDNGIKLIVFGVPIEPIDLTENFDNFDYFDVDLNNDSVDFNYKYHSLNSCFRNFLIIKKIQNLHFDNDGHWNVIGHIAAHDCIVNFLEKENLM